LNAAIQMQTQLPLILIFNLLQGWVLFLPFAHFETKEKKAKVKRFKSSNREQHAKATQSDQSDFLSRNKKGKSDTE